MSRCFLAFTVAVAIAAFASSASAALLNLPLRPDPEISASGIAFNDPGLLGFVFTASGGSSTPPAEATGLDITLVADLDGAGSLGFLGGALNVGNAEGLFLGGLVSKTGFEIDAAGSARSNFS